MPNDRRLAAQLAIFAGAALYLELAIIRFTAAEVLYLGFFSNFILISAFVGLGIGFLAARREIDLGRHIPFALLFLFALVLVSEFDVSTLRNRFGLFFFGNVLGRAGLPGAVLLCVLFLSTVALFAGLGNVVARLFARFHSLDAYHWDLVGSLVGIGLFTWQSANWAGPAVWVLTGSLLLVLGWLLDGSREALRRAAGVAAAGLAVILLLLSSREGHLTTWSSYQKLELVEQAPTNTPVLFANGIAHQIISPAEEASRRFYGIPYALHEQVGGRLGRVLIVGAGTGTDVAVALRMGAEQIDAVEIDRGIYEIGRDHHPDRPYDDPRVTVHVADGREFIRNSQDRYDLIVFALPDSLTRLSSMASIRLESYLFTLESFREVRAHLAEGGHFVLYNEYRWSWLVHRIRAMLEEVFEGPAMRIEAPPTTVLAAGEGLVSGRVEGQELLRPATDDWPFLYMQRPAIHWLYVGMIAMFLATALVGVRGLAPAGTLRRPDWPFFFMGAAFLLLETKSLAFFSLLFGTTWLVNSLAFAGILTSVLAANWIVRAGWVRRRGPLFVALFGSLALAFAIPHGALLGIEAPSLRYVAAVALVFAPIFCANLVFSHELSSIEEGTRSFGWNLLGAVAGGGLEYLSLAVGFRNLLWIAAACYAATALAIRHRERIVTP